MSRITPSLLLIVLSLLAISSAQSAAAQEDAAPLTTDQGLYLESTDSDSCRFQQPYRALTRHPLFSDDATETLTVLDGESRYDDLFVALMGNEAMEPNLYGGACASKRLDDEEAMLDLDSLTWLAYDAIAVRGMSGQAGRIGTLLRDSRLVTRTRRALTRSLIMLNARDQHEALAASLTDGNWDRAHEAMTLGALAHWESDAAIPYCLTRLAGSNGAECAMYLARRNHRAATDRIAFRARQLGPRGVIALSMLGHRPTRAFARSEFARSEEPEMLVAMINLGDGGATRRFAEVFASGNFRSVGYLAFLTNRGARRAAVAYLRREGSSRAGRDAESRGLAAAIRLQLGDRSAAAAVREILRGSDDGARRKTMEFLGYGILSGSYDPARHGLGLVAEPRVVADLRYIFEMDADSRPAAGPLWAFNNNAR